MAKVVVAALTLLTIAVKPAMAADVQVPDDVATAADKAGVDPVDLLGATVTTGLDPYEYLYQTGELKRPAPQPPPVPQIAYGIWDALASCESGQNWRANTGNGYYGGIQEDLVFWSNYGGKAFAARPDLASREAQIMVGQRGQAVQGWGAWPSCSRHLGLRW